MGEIYLLKLSLTYARLLIGRSEIRLIATKLGPPQGVMATKRGTMVSIAIEGQRR